MSTLLVLATALAVAVVANLLGLPWNTALIPARSGRKPAQNNR
jgi:hypothetical protein